MNAFDEMVTPADKAEWIEFVEANTPKDAEWIIDYTKKTRDTRHLISYLRQRWPITPELFDLLTAILAGTVHGMKLRDFGFDPKQTKAWCGMEPKASALKAYIRRIRRELESGDRDREFQAAKLKLLHEKKGELTNAATSIAAAMFRVSVRKLNNDWLYPDARQRKRRADLPVKQF